MSKAIKDRKSKINEYTKLARKRGKRPDYYDKALKATWLDNEHGGFIVVDIVCLVFTIIALAVYFEIVAGTGTELDELPFNIFATISLIFWTLLCLVLQLSSWIDPFLKFNKSCDFFKGSCRSMIVISCCLLFPEKKDIFSLFTMLGAIALIALNIKCLAYLRKYKFNGNFEDTSGNRTLTVTLGIEMVAAFIQVCLTLRGLTRNYEISMANVARALNTGIIDWHIYMLAFFSALAAFILIMIMFLFYQRSNIKMQCTIISATYACGFNVFSTIVVSSKSRYALAIYTVAIICTFISYLGAFMAAVGAFDLSLRKIKMEVAELHNKRKRDDADSKTDVADSKRTKAEKKRRSPFFEYDMVFEMETDALREVYDEVMGGDDMDYFRDMNITIEEVDKFTCKLSCRIRRPFIYNLSAYFSNIYDKKEEHRLTSELISELQNRLYVGM